ncbi:hypothetical protein AVEN_23165-1 [Araneus ventricosus]|uniref:Uncharacterized protein n=1 Tax=Araneus ventricosus TaxID=182803 RepID=A0A4Y2FHR2_ARAVE|nr:hypothetical protein AVEN_23165-1 [Araneus ventricosus]
MPNTFFCAPGQSTLISPLSESMQGEAIIDDWRLSAESIDRNFSGAVCCIGKPRERNEGNKQVRSGNERGVAIVKTGQDRVLGMGKKNLSRWTLWVKNSF